MINSRLIPYISGGGDAATVAEQFIDRTKNDEALASKSFAANAMINGAFNVNSTSVDAWRAVLSSMRDAAVSGYSANGTNVRYGVGEKTAFVRTGLALQGPADDSMQDNLIRWAGFRALTDDQIESLANGIVEEIRARNEEDDAPSLSLGDFINRRLDNASSLHALKGILQTAIDKTDINQRSHQDSNSISSAALPATRLAGLTNRSALDGFTGDGAPPMLTQGDLLIGLAPIITVRGDTFTIRSYGEAKASNGTTILARAWCEATVQRVPDYVDPQDPADFDIGFDENADIMNSNLSEANKLFGRRFIMTSFRWLSASEV
ncbi:MAG: hypothetical protein EOP85_20625 [Verrucomicrobiaceae bacterium]|nr:MAG: hypothetical protein EOP85_20625 [Verrucomicrobiaceae bacterium]